MTARELLGKLDSVELTEWMAFYQLEPFGQDWLQTAVQSAAAQAPFAKKGQPPQLDKFMPVKPRLKEMSDADFVRMIQALAIKNAKADKKATKAS